MFGDVGEREHERRFERKEAERRVVETGSGESRPHHRVDAPQSGTGYFGRSPATMAFSSFNSFSVAVSLLRLNSLTGKPGTTDHFLPSLRMGKE
jgi:hypothetical protein